MAKVEIANPQQTHCATVLLFDTTSSVQGEKITGLTEGLTVFKKDIVKDKLASGRDDLAFVTFGEDVSVIYNFSSIEDFEPLFLYADRYTPTELCQCLYKSQIEFASTQFGGQVPIPVVADVSELRYEAKGSIQHDRLCLGKGIS